MHAAALVFHNVQGVVVVLLGALGGLGVVLVVFMSLKKRA
jgi:hypothetical protein